MSQISKIIQAIIQYYLSVDIFNSLSSAEDQLALANANITHILSVTDEKVRFPEGLELTIKRLELGDYSHEVSIVFSHSQRSMSERELECYTLILGN